MTISGYLEEDHRRIERLLGAADTGNAEAYREFRGALLRHIGIEEKMLFPAIRSAAGSGSFAGIEQLHLDHGALAALLVPSPTASILAAIHSILRQHNIIEEGPGGVYGRFEQLPGIDAGGILARSRAAPPVAMNPHVDNSIAIESMRAAVRRAGYSFEL